MLIDIQQGTHISPRQRLILQQQQQVRSFMNPILTESVNQALKAVEIRKEQGAKPERIWFIDRQEKGTPSMAEWMGY